MISIIIPCYNSEKYIDKNLQSLINQTNKNFKAIFIDDGSKDKTSYTIRNKLDKSTVNYEIYEMEHQGVGSARNYGIRICNTPYLMFLDSDDYLRSDCIENIIKTIQDENFDIIVGKYQHEYNNKIIWEYNKSYIDLNGEFNSQYVLDLIFDNKIHICTSNAVYKSTLFNYINFDKECMYHEDLNVFYKIINKSKSVQFIDKNMFVYVIRNNSISHAIDVNKLKQGIYMLEELYKELEKDNVSRKIIKKIKYKTIPNLCYLFFNKLCIENPELISIYKENNYFNIMKNTKLENYSISALIKFIRIKMIGYIPKTYKMFWRIYQEKVKSIVRG